MNKKLQLAEEFLEEGKIELTKYETRGKETALWQACEKGWATVAQALKAINPEIKRHVDFGRTAMRLTKEYDNEKIMLYEALGEHLHRAGFYEGLLDKEEVEYSLLHVEHFLNLIDNISSNGGGKVR